MRNALSTLFVLSAVNHRLQCLVRRLLLPCVGRCYDYPVTFMGTNMGITAWASHHGHYSMGITS